MNTLSDESRRFGGHGGRFQPRSIRAEILILTARINFNP